MGARCLGPRFPGEALYAARTRVSARLGSEQEAIDMDAWDPNEGRLHANCIDQLRRTHSRCAGWIEGLGKEGRGPHCTCGGISAFCTRPLRSLAWTPSPRSRSPIIFRLNWHPKSERRSPPLRPSCLDAREATSLAQHVLRGPRRGACLHCSVF